jgi:hypothetical protein
MRSRLAVTTGPLAAVLLLALATWSVVPPAGAAGTRSDHAERCHQPRPARAPASADAAGGRPHRVTGFACGEALYDFAGSPIAETNGSIVLTRVGRARFRSVLAVDPVAEPGFSRLTGTLTVTDRRGTIVFDYDGRLPTISLTVGATTTGPARMVAIAGTGAYRQASGTLDLVVTGTVTSLPTPTTATFDVRFTVDGTLSFRGPPPGGVPEPVTGVLARRGAGSGETDLVWEASAGATGYRVLRSPTPAGPFADLAGIDVVTGATDAAAEVVYLRSDQHTYVPASGPLPAPDTSTSFLLIEYSEAPSRCYRVVAHNAAGDAAPSPVACASPP